MPENRLKPLWEGMVSISSGPMAPSARESVKPGLHGAGLISGSLALRAHRVATPNNFNSIMTKARVDAMVCPAPPNGGIATQW